MNPTPATAIETPDIEALAAKLSEPSPALGASGASGAPGVLTEAERSLLVSALSHLAGDQAVIVRLRRLLTAHEDSGARLDAILAEGSRAVGDALGRAAPSAGYDFDAARLAREQLAQAVAEARDARRIIAAALAFARDTAALL